MTFLEFLKTKKFFKHLLLSFAVTLTVIWITLLLLRMYTRHGQSIEVPSYIGLTVEKAKDFEASKTFTFQVDSVYELHKTPGTIISQDPLPKTKVKSGRTIYFSVVSYKPDQVHMPNLVDISLRQAKASLQTYGLVVGKITFVPDMAKNAVQKALYKGQPIAPGTLIDRGAKIDLVVGSGRSAQVVQVPSLIGKYRNEAIQEIERLGLILGSESYESGDNSDARVYSQSPAYIFGKKIPSGTIIDLTYRSDSFDFDSYMKTLKVDSLKVDSTN